MLTAFTARPIVELRARDKSRIQSLVAYGDRLVVGLNTGALRIYRVNDVAPSASSPSTSVPTSAKHTGPTAPTHLLREVEKFASRGIEHLAIIKEANTLVSLANYAVSLHDLHSFAPLPGLAPLPGTKNASAFAVTSNIVPDPVTSIPEIVSRLAVAVKRRLLIWTWFASELTTATSVDRTEAADIHADSKNGGNAPPPEIILPDAIRSLTWVSTTKLIVGMNAGYVLVDVVARTCEDIVGGHNSSNGNGNSSDHIKDNHHNGNTVSTSDFVNATSRFGALGSASMGYMGLGNYMPKPMATKLADGIVMLAKDVHTLFVTDDGRPLDRRPIPWPTAPETVGYSYPYVLSLTSGGTSRSSPSTPVAGTLEVRNPETQNLLQAIQIPLPPTASSGGSSISTGPLQLHLPSPSSSLAHAGKGFQISSERGIWKLEATAYDDQISTLVDEGKLDEAISVLGLLEDALLGDKKLQILRNIKMLKAEDLFRKRKYLASMDLFNEEDVHAPPERVLRFFPRSIVGDLSDEAESDEGGERAEAEPSTPAATNGEEMVKEDRQPEDSGEISHASHVSQPQPEPQQPTETPLSIASGFSAMFLGHRRTNSDAASITPPLVAKKADSEVVPGDGAKKPPGENGVPDGNGHVRLQGKELMRAAEALNSYLAGTRARLQRVIDPATGKLKEDRAERLLKFTRSHEKSEGADTEEDEEAREKRLRATFTLIDTTMFRVLMLIRPKLASSLFRIPNFCDPVVVNERLLETNRYNELVDFFYGKRLHRQALELLRRFGEKKEEKADSSEDETEDNTAVEVPPALQGPRRTVAYLQSLPSDLVDLVLEFSDWTLRADPVLGMEVFLADSENAETLPRDRVARFLAGIDDRLEIQYLEHVISELNDLTPDFHNRLIEQRIKLLRQGHGDSAEEQAAWNESMARLVSFLEESHQYSLSRALELIPRDDPSFYDGQAVVLSNMGQHKQALEIYVFRMQDTAKAEAYCNRIYEAQEAARKATPAAIPTSPHMTGIDGKRMPWHKPLHQAQDDNTAGDGGEDEENESTPSIYHTLLSLYLKPPPSAGKRKGNGKGILNGDSKALQPQLGPALDLLSKHGARLPASSTLSLIPDDLSVAQLAAYFRGRMRSTNSAVHAIRIERGLRQTALMAAQAMLLLGPEEDGRTGRSRHVVVGEERACGVCHKRLGGSVVAVLPDNAVVHYGCLDRVSTAASRDRTAPWGHKFM